MAVESVKQNSVAMVVQQQANQAQMKKQPQEAPQQNPQTDDRVTLNSRQNEAQGANNQQSKNLAMAVPGQSQRPGAGNTEDTNRINNNNIIAQQIAEAAKKTASMQQASNAYSPSKPAQTQNQINYTA